MSARLRGTMAGCALLAGAALAPAVVLAQAPVDQLRWLAGCWEQREGARITHEQWMLPAGNLMLGSSRTVVRDTVRATEVLRIESRGGVATYVALPSGQRETAFAASSISDSMVVFANPAHDFPQRISYRRLGADSLVARIEGSRNGQMRSVDFPMRRVSCTGL